MKYLYQVVLMDKRNYIVSYRNIDSEHQLIMYISENCQKEDTDKIEITRFKEGEKI